MKQRHPSLPWILFILAAALQEHEATLAPLDEDTTAMLNTSMADFQTTTTMPPAHSEADQPSPVFSRMSPEQKALLMKLLDVFHTYLYIVIGGCGVLGNGLNLGVLLRERQALSPFTYMTAIAACDLVSGLCLLFLACVWYRRFNELHFATRLLSYYVSLPVFALNEACATAAGLLAMALSLDRMVAIRFPLKRSALCTVRVARIISAALVSLGLIINVQTLFRLEMRWSTRNGVETVQLYYTDFGKDPHVNNLVRSLALIFRFLVPFTTMIVTSVITIQALLQSHRFRRQAAAAQKQVEMSALSRQCLGITVGVTIAFFVTQMPRSAYYVDSMLHGNQHRGYFEYEVFMYVNESMAWSNININFFIYAALSKSFRKSVKNIFHCGRRSGEASPRSVETRVTSITTDASTGAKY